MNYQKIKDALQDLIIRLQDAEKGYTQISEYTKNMTLKSWADKFSKERHQMHRTLESHMKDINGDPEVKTSILGDLHRMFIDFKFSMIDDSVESTVAEIQRGSKKLISDYETVLKDVEMPQDILSTLVQQKSAIEAELRYIKDSTLAYEAVNA